MWTAIAKILSGDLFGALERAYTAKVNSTTEQEKIAAEQRIKLIEAEIDARRQATQIRLSTAGFWEMRLLSFLIAGCFTLHLVLVTLDTCFKLGWKVFAYPAPFSEWEGAILLSFFGIQAASKGITAIATALSSRR